MRADQKLTPDARRELLDRALSGEPKIYLANEYGISRGRLYTLLEEARAITEEDVAEARRDYEWKRRVWENREIRE